MNRRYRSESSGDPGQPEGAARVAVRKQVFRLLLILAGGVAGLLMQLRVHVALAGG
jgi:hypothetical protein